MGILRRTRDGRRESLSPESVVGRAETSELRLDAGFVSVRHALLRWAQPGWELRDLGSTNGTYVDGTRIAGKSVQLRSGAQLSFGEPSETWVLVDDSPPVPAALSLQGAPVCRFASGSIVIPNEINPAATIYALEGQWILETVDSRTPLRPNQEFCVGGTAWVFHCPQGTAATVATTEQPFRFEECTLMLSVSSDEERVALRLRRQGRCHDLGMRAAFYLILVLARQRIADRALATPQRGWIDVSDVLRKIPDYNGDGHVNVDIWRMRRLLADAGMLDAPSVFERRRGQIRLGTDRIEIHREVEDAVGNAQPSP